MLDREQQKMKKKKRIKRTDTHESAYALCEDRELTLTAFKSGMFLIKATQGKFEINLNMSKKHGEKTDNSSIRIYVNKIEDRIKAGYHLKL